VDYVFPNEAEFQWSILIVLYPFITGLVAGAFVVSSLYHVFGMKALRPVARMALIAALAFLLIAPVSLQLHLGRPERAFLIFIMPHFTSAMAGFGYIWMFYLILVTVETWLVFRPDIVALAQKSTFPLKTVYHFMALGVYDVSEEAMEVDHKLIKILAAVGIPAAALLHGYVGFIFGAIKANPWWSTPLMPVIFLLSAIVSGIALLTVMYVLSMKLLNRAIDHECVRALGGLLAAFLLVDLTLEGLELLSMAYEQEESWPLVRGLIGRLAPSFLGLQITMGAVLPLLVLGTLSLTRVRKELSTFLTAGAALFVVIGVFAMRWNVVVGGQMLSKSLRGYVEYEWIWGGREGILMAALILCVPLVLFTVFAYLLPPWVEPEAEPEAAAVPEPVIGEPEPVFASDRVKRGYVMISDAPPKSYAGLKLALAGLAGLMGMLFLGVLTLPGTPGLLDIGGSRPPIEFVPQVRVAFAAPEAKTISKPEGGSWVEPLDVTILNGRVFVLDHTGVQVVEIDQDGRFIRSFNQNTVPGLNLLHPHTLSNDGKYIYIGNTFPPRVYVLDPDAGVLKESIVLPPTEIEGLPAVPTGSAFTADGKLVVADAQNHRLLILTRDGQLLRTVNQPNPSVSRDLAGTVTPTSSSAAAAALTNVATTGRPGTVGVLPDGTILALDILGPGIMRVNPDGTFAGDFGRPSDPKGGVFTPTDVVVDGEGRIFVSDDLLQGVQVYASDGTSLGMLGRPDPNSFVDATPILAHPSAMALDGNKLWVVDRGKGLVVFTIPGVPETTAQGQP
jgi:predicted membrane protein